MKKILYISYDGILEPLGQSQVLSYQEILAKSHQIILISFEKSKFTSSNEFHKLTEERVLKAGYINWISALTVLNFSISCSDSSCSKLCPSCYWASVKKNYTHKISV
jgi:hypothetical protein